MLTVCPKAVASVAVAACLLLSGCESRSGADAVGGPREGTGEAGADRFARIWDEVVAAYSNATSYRDDAVLHIEYSERGEGLLRESEERAAIAFDRPNRIRIERTASTGPQSAALERLALSDGRNLYVAVSELPGQLLEQPCPPRIAVEQLINDSTARNAILPVAAENLMPQLMLCTSPDPIRRLVSEARSRKLVGEEPVDGVTCNGLEFVTPVGTYRYWVDPRTHLIRRVDLPAAVFQEFIDPERQLQQVKVWLEIRSPELNGTLPAETFVLQPPETCVRVSRLVTSHPGPPPVGPDFTTRDRDAYDAALLVYHRELSEAAIAGQSFLIDAAAPQITSASEFETLRRTERWTNRDVVDPGNITVIESASNAVSVLVIEGHRSVVEFDLGGNVLARHALDLPDDEGISFIRTIVDGQGGRWFLASGNARQQLHLFDESWTKAFSYPSGTHDGIADAQFGDLDDDGVPEIYVGYWGAVGVQGVSLTGKRLWSDRSLEHVLHVTTLPGRDVAGGQLWCINGRGTLARFSAREQLRELKVADRVLIDVAFADVDRDGTYAGCGLAFNDVGKYEVLGIDATAQELWSYVLPEGEFRTQTARIIPAAAPGVDAGWLVPAADGSLHLLSASRGGVDRMNCGSAVTGAAIVETGDEFWLLIASPSGVIASTLEPAESSTE